MIVMAGTDERDLTKLAEYEAIGGYGALAEGARDVAERGDRRGALHPSSAAAAAPFFPTGREVVASSRSRIRTRTRTTSSSTPTSRSRAASRTTRSWRASRTGFIEGCLHRRACGRVEERLRLHPRRVHRAVRDPASPRSKELRGAARPARRRDDRRCTAARAPTSAARRRRCSSRSRASAASRARSLRFRRSQGLYASPTVVNNVETMATVPPIIEMGGAEYAKLGVAGFARDSASSRSPGTSSSPGNYEIENGTSLRELIYGLGGGIPGGRELKAVIPGGSSTVILKGDEIDVGYDFNSLAQAEHGDGIGRRRRARRPLLHGAARHPHLGVLRARVVRQVHAVPRGHALDDADPARSSRSGEAVQSELDSSARRLRPDQRQVPVPARRDGGDRGRELRREVPRRVRRARRAGRLSVRRDSSPLHDVLAPVAIHAPPSAVPA